MERERLDLERQFEQELRTSDIRRQPEVHRKFKHLRDNLDRERFERDRQTQNQIQQTLGNLERERYDRERQLWDEQQRNFSRLEQRRFELEGELERLRMDQERYRMEQEDRDRFAREMQQDQERFQRQEESERQRSERERQRRDQGRSNLEFVQASSSIGDPGDRPRFPSKGLPSRGFFTNSASGSMSDVDNFMDPTTLAVLGILLTLVATSLSLVKGN